MICILLDTQFPSLFGSYGRHGPCPTTAPATRTRTAFKHPGRMALYRCSTLGNGAYICGPEEVVSACLSKFDYTLYVNGTVFIRCTSSILTSHLLDLANAAVRTHICVKAIGIGLLLSIASAHSATLVNYPQSDARHPFKPASSRHFVSLISSNIKALIDETPRHPKQNGRERQGPLMSTAQSRVGAYIPTIIFETPYSDVAEPTTPTRTSIQTFDIMEDWNGQSRRLDLGALATSSC